MTKKYHTGMKVGLFGGTFDPPHAGHIALAKTLRDMLHLDEVWLMVTPQNPWKRNSTLSDDKYRYEMVSLAVEEIEGLLASDYEFSLEKPTYTYKTLRHLRADFPEISFVLIIGGDNWAAFDKWAEYEEILQHHRVVVYPRPGCDIITPKAVINFLQMNEGVSNQSERVTVVEAETYDVSSTEIRRRIVSGQDIKDLVMPAVEKYIVEKKLYASRA